jgi:DNA repair exonuclease SbcCD ATPase subunit
MFWKKYYSKSSKKDNKDLEEERRKVQDYQEETFYILQKLKQMKVHQVDLERIQKDQFRAYLNNLFSKRSQTLTMISEKTLHSLYFLKKKMCTCQSDPNSQIFYKEKRHGNDWVETFVKELKSNEWRFDNTIFENFKKEISKQWSEMKELNKDIKAKVEYEEEILILKNQLVELKNQLLEEQMKSKNQFEVQNSEIGELKEKNERLNQELQILKDSLSDKEIDKRH